MTFSFALVCDLLVPRSVRLALPDAELINWRLGALMEEDISQQKECLYTRIFSLYSVLYSRPSCATTSSRTRNIE